MSLDLRVGWPESGLAGAYARGEEAASRFYGGDWRDGASVRARAEAVRASFDLEARQRAAAALRPSGEAARRKLERVVREGGFLVTTGQQPGLFTGPLYTVYKALAAAALAELLQDQLDAPVLPVFWVASEDHDWAEVDHVHLIGVDNALHTVRLPPQEGSTRQPLHRLALEDGILAVVEETLSLLPDTDFSRTYGALVREAWRPGVTLPEGVRTTLARLLEPFGVALVDAADPALKEASLPVLRREIEGAAAHEVALLERAAALEEAGWPVQVPVLEGGVNLFVEGRAGRERLYRNDGAFRLHPSGESVDADALVARLDAEPATLSPNVLLRPVVEAAALPTVAYVAGPGETAYWAQLEPLFRAHGVAMPALVPRLSVTVVESKVAKVLDKFSLTVRSLSRPFHEVAGDVAREELPDGVRHTLGELRSAVGRGTTALEEEARAIDPTLKGPMRRARTVVLDAVADAEKKIVQALKRQNGVTLRQIEKARLHLFPGERAQERVVNVLYYLTRYGEAFLDDVACAVRSNLADALGVHEGERAGVEAPLPSGEDTG